jgi:hypothetical protein
MKNIFFILCFSFYIFSLQAQVGFSKANRFGYFAADFDNVILDNDTLVAFGETRDSFAWRCSFIKMDTFGNVLLHKRYEFGKYPDDFYADDGNSLIKTSDGGYALVGQKFDSDIGIFNKFKKNGDLAFTTYIPKQDTIGFTRFTKMIEFKEAFYIISERQKKKDNKIQYVLTKINKKGNIVWEKVMIKDIGEINSIMPVDNNIVLAGFYYDKKAIFIRSIDSTGNIINQIDKFQKFHGCQHFQKTAFGYTYSMVNQYPKLNIPDPVAFYREYFLVGTDDSLNILWQKQIGFVSLNPNEAKNICKVGKDEYVGLFRMCNTKGSGNSTNLYPPDQYCGSFIQKYNTKGEMLWNRFDTLFWTRKEINLSENVLVSAVALPSGNIICVGWSQKRFQPNTGVHSWVLKLSKDGCLLEPACGISATGENFDIQEFRVFPNPTSSIFTVEWKVPNESTWRLYLRDYSGRIVQQSEIAAGALRQTLQVENLANGLYFYELRASSGKHLESGKIIIQK